MPNEQDWERVAEAVRRRRIELNLTQEEAVVASERSISQVVWSKLENAKQDEYRERTLQGVARALDWPRDAIEQLLAGADPDTLTPTSPPAQKPELETISAYAAKMTPENRARLEERARAILEEQGEQVE